MSKPQRVSLLDESPEEAVPKAANKTKTQTSDYPPLDFKTQRSLTNEMTAWQNKTFAEKAVDYANLAAYLEMMAGKGSGVVNYTAVFAALFTAMQPDMSWDEIYYYRGGLVADKDYGSYGGFVVRDMRAANFEMWKAVCGEGPPVGTKKYSHFSQRGDAVGWYWSFLRRASNPDSSVAVARTAASMARKLAIDSMASYVKSPFPGHAAPPQGYSGWGKYKLDLFKTEGGLLTHVASPEGVSLKKLSVLDGGPAKQILQEGLEQAVRELSAVKKARQEAARERAERKVKTRV